MLFGASDIGATVRFDVYGLGKHCESILDAFPAFIRRARETNDSPEHVLARKYAALKKQIRDQECTKRALHANLRKANGQLDRADAALRTKDRGAVAKEARATGLALNHAIEKLREAVAECQRLKDENLEIEGEIDEIVTRHKNQPGDRAALEKRIVKGEGELVRLRTEWEDQLQEMEAEIGNITPSVEARRARLRDLERRIIVCRPKVPRTKTDTGRSKRSTKRGMPLPRAGILRAQFVHL
jgi:chromosome segregation ATPase